VINNYLDVAIGGVFAFYELNLSLSTVCGIFNSFALCVEGVSNRADEIRFVMFGFVLRW
jgi:hypothetical protein